MNTPGDRTVLELDSQILCPHCRTRHPVTIGHPESTPYTQAML
jgi:hypothetical protein